MFNCDLDIDGDASLKEVHEKLVEAQDDWVPVLLDLLQDCEDVDFGSSGEITIGLTQDGETYSLSISDYSREEPLEDLARKIGEHPGVYQVSYYHDEEYGDLRRVVINGEGETATNGFEVWCEDVDRFVSVWFNDTYFIDGDAVPKDEALDLIYEYASGDAVYETVSTVGGTIRQLLGLLSRDDERIREVATTTLESRVDELLLAIPEESRADYAELPPAYLIEALRLI